jgi:uncharacterized protein YjbI with pentapeptide repeats
MPAANLPGANEYDGCPHSSHGGSDYCIFHIPLKEKRNHPTLVDEFRAAFDSFFTDKFLKDNAGDFQGFVFPDKIDLSKRDFRRSYERDDPSAELPEDHRAVNFQWAEVGDIVRFSGANFGNKASFSRTIFGNETNFSNAMFGNEASFIDAKFGAKNDFSDTFFGDQAYFFFSSFGSDSNFKSSKFGDRANFISTTFGPRTTFRVAIFGHDAYFIKATLGTNLDFFKVTFGDAASFFNSTFKGEVNFSEIKASEHAFSFKSVGLGEHNEFEGQITKPSSSRHISFRDAIFDGPALFRNTDLSRVRFEQVNIQNLSFYRSKVSQTEFVSCQWGSGPEGRKHWHRSGGPIFRFKRPRLLLDELLWRKKNQKERGSVPLLLRTARWLLEIYNLHRTNV